MADAASTTSTDEEMLEIEDHWQKSITWKGFKFLNPGTEIMREIAGVRKSVVSSEK